MYLYKYFVFVFKYIPIVFETTKIHSKYPASYFIRALINLAVIIIILDSPVSLQLPFLVSPRFSVGGESYVLWLSLPGVTRMRISADPCGTIRKRNADLGIARCIDKVCYGGCRILYRLFILSEH